MRDPVKKMLKDARHRARISCLPFDLTEADITVPDCCPILGIPLRRAKGRPDGNSPSLDRIDNVLGYVKDNVQVISYRANTMKHDATKEELLRFAAWINEHLR
jgi:hypothetical protein